MHYLLLLSLFVHLLSCASAQQNAQGPSSDPYSCSATKPCKIGCCSNSGVCGLGPVYCSAANCTSGCDSKSECDPGWGSAWSTTEKCPLNVCCSKFGFCGVTSEFCGSATVRSPSCSASSNSAAERIIGYYEGWSTTRSCGGLFPEDLRYDLYTHLNYAFAFVDPNTFAVAPMQDLDTQLYPRFTALKQQNPGLQTWISIGGWSMNDPDQPTAKTFSTLAGSTTAQNAFFKSLVNFMSTYGFDGVDIDWEYPVAPERSGNTADFANYVSFLKNLRNALGSAGGRYGLTITIPSSYWYMRNFDIVSLEPYVDWFNVMTYDLHGTWDSTDPYIGAIVNSHTNLSEIDQTMELLWRNNIDPKKVSMGMGFYGRSFTLSDPSCNTAGCGFSAGGSPGPCTASAGTLSYAEIENIISAGSSSSHVDTVSQSVIVTWAGNQWVSYDNAQTLTAKMQYANSKCLGGVMIWAASTDDASGTAIQALTGAAGRTSLSLARQKRSQAAITGQCVWSDCSGNCPSDTQAIAYGSGKSGGFINIYHTCPNGANRKFCCPNGNPPTCRWRGSAVSVMRGVTEHCQPACNGKCHSNEVEVASDLSGGAHTCWTGHKVLCCEDTQTDTNYGACEWQGAAPICATWNFFAVILNNPYLYYNSHSCPSDFPNKTTTGKYGYGGEQPCSELGGFKSFCCKNPAPWQNCAWHGARGTWTEWANAFYAASFGPVTGVLNAIGATPFLQDCTTSCPAGQVVVATDGTDCTSGTYSLFCCDDPNAPSLPTTGDLNLCAAPSPDQNMDSNTAEDGDTDGNSNDFFESEYYELNCGDTFNDGLNDNNWNYGYYKRSVQEDSDLLDEEYLQERGLEYLVERAGNGLPPKSGNSRLMPVCTINPSNGLIVRWLIRRYLWPAVLRLANNGLTYISQDNPTGCGRARLVSGARMNNQQYDTEHVFPSSQLRNAIQFMYQGAYPNGTALPQGSIPFNLMGQVIGSADVSTGAFHAYWTNLPGNINPSFGTTPEETAMALLGTRDATGAPNGHLNNFAILNRNVNQLRGIITNRQNFVNTQAWNRYNHLQRFARLRDAVNVFDYYRRADIITAYQTTYRALNQFWGQFRTGAQNIINYDFATAFANIVRADLQQQATNAQNQFNAVLNTELTFWRSPAAAAQYGSVFARSVAATLADFQTNITTYLGINVNSLL